LVEYLQESSHVENHSGVYKIESTRHKCTTERNYEPGTAASPSDL
jgi:hypothetical protein